MPRTRVQRLIDTPGLTQTPVKPIATAAVEKPLLSLEDAARAMGIGINSLKGLIADGTVYSIPVGDTGKHRRVPLAEIEKFMGVPKPVATSRTTDDLAAVVKALDRAAAAIDEARRLLQAYERNLSERST